MEKGPNWNVWITWRTRQTGPQTYCSEQSQCLSTLELDFLSRATPEQGYKSRAASKTELSQLFTKPNQATSYLLVNSQTTNRNFNTESGATSICKANFIASICIEMESVLLLKLWRKFSRRWALYKSLWKNVLQKKNNFCLLQRKHWCIKSTLVSSLFMENATRVNATNPLGSISDLLLTYFVKTS